MVKRLGKYTILKKLGEGPLGDVYEAEDTERSFPVAIRFLPEEFGANPALKSGIYGACRAAAALEHPNIAGIQWAGEEGNRLYVVTEWLDGQSLRGLLDGKTEIPLENKLAIMIQVAEGLDHAHRNRIVHSKLRPGNIHLTPAGIIKIRDFGLSVRPDPELAHLRMPVYLAPELIQGKEGGERADIFSAGVVFYELLTSAHPFHSQQGPNPVESDLFDSTVSTVESFPDVPLGFWPILEICLQKDPGDRYANMGEVLAACRALFEDLVEVSELMRKELRVAMARLKLAAEKPGASIKVAKLARDVERVLANESADHASLQALTLSLADHYPLLRSVGEGTPGGTPVVPLVLPHARPAANTGSRAAAAERSVVPSDSSDGIAVLERPPMLERPNGPPVGEVSPESHTEPDSTSPPGNSEDPVAQLLKQIHSTATDTRDLLNSRGEAYHQDSTKSVKPESSTAGAPPADARIEEPDRKSAKVAQAPTQSSKTVFPEYERSRTDRLEQAHAAPETAKRPKPRILLWSAAAGLFALLILGLWARNSSSAHSLHQSRLGAARLSLERKLFDDAISMCKTVLAQSPDDEQAGAILLQAENGKRQLRTASLLHEAQTLLSEGRRAEGKERLERILAVDPACQPARELLTRLTVDLPAQQDRDQEAAGWPARVSGLIQSGNLARAKAEIDKAEQVLPGRPEILAMRKEWAAKNAEITARGKADEAFARRVEELYRRGNYGEAQKVLARWTDENPQSARAQALRARTAEVQRILKSYEAALGEKRYDDALEELSKLGQINPVDPNLAELRKRAESRKAGGKALLTVYRLGEPAGVMLDGQPIASNGEVENRSIAAGKHTLTVRNSSGFQALQTAEFLDGQSVVFVYDAANLQLREMRDADRELLNHRKMAEGVHRFAVQHRHGLLRGKCEGELILNYNDVEYRPKSGSHAFRIPVRSLKLRREAEKIHLYHAMDGKEFRSFETVDSHQAETLLQVWGKFEGMRK